MCGRAGPCISRSNKRMKNASSSAEPQQQQRDCCAPAGWSLLLLLLLPMKPNTAAGPTQTSSGLINASRKTRMENYFNEHSRLSRTVLYRQTVSSHTVSHQDAYGDIGTFSLRMLRNIKGKIIIMQQHLL